MILQRGLHGIAGGISKAMSKLERQIEQIAGESRVEISWPFGEDIDIDVVRNRLRYEIDLHEDRVPLDLRGVHGVPPALLELLIESGDYAIRKGKRMTVSYASPAMQDALRRRKVPQNLQRANADTDEGRCASDIANAALKSQGPAPVTRTMDSAAASIAEAKANARNLKGRSKRRFSRIIKLGSIIIAATSVIAAVEFYLLMGETETVTLPTKTYEITK